MKRYKSKFTEELRSVEVIFDNGSKLITDMATGLSDKDITDYYRKGKEFNLGSGQDDLIVRVKKVRILK